MFSSVVLSCSNEKSVVQDVEVNESENIFVSKQQFENSNFKLGKPTLQDFEKNTSVPGKVIVAPKDQVVVSSLLEGKVSGFKIVEGQQVNKGQFLFSVINPNLIDLQQEFLEKLAEIKYLESEYKRLESLKNENLTTENEFSKMQSDYMRSKVVLSALKNKLETYGVKTGGLKETKLNSSIGIFAPVSGKIASINLIEGMYIQSDFAAFQIINDQTKYISLDVLEKDAMAMEIGQEISFVKLNNTDIYQAKIKSISPGINDSHTLKVIGEITSENKLIPGSYIQASITETTNKTYALPESAVVKVEDKRIALVLKNQDDEGYYFEPLILSDLESSNGLFPLTSATDQTFLITGAYYLL